MDLTKNKNTYMYWLAQEPMLHYLQDVAQEDLYETSIIDFYDAIMFAVSNAPQLGRTKIFINQLTDAVRNTKTSARSQARKILRAMARCMNVDPAVLMPKKDPKTIILDVLSEPEKVEIDLEEQERKAAYLEQGLVEAF